MTYRSRTSAALLIVLFCWQASGQMKVVKMPPPINRPAVNNSSPFISLEGESLLFISDNTEDRIPSVFYTSTPDGANWKEPLLLSKLVNSKLNFLRGYSLSADGRKMYISGQRGGGLGGFDLYVCDLTGSFWSEPVNIGQPINSKGNEACASFTTDGLQIYFMRCDKMDAQRASGCRIWTSTRRLITSSWTAPVELPATINSGNSQSPRIMGDGETLIFSSDKLGGKGGMDLFISTRTGETWSKPVALDFVNTSADDQFVSATSTGRYLLTEVRGNNETELVELLFPPEVKPKGVMKVDGHVTGLTNPTAAYISLFDLDTDAKVATTRPDKMGAFNLYLKEGMRYSVAVDPEEDTFTFFTKGYDLKANRVNTMTRLNAPLKQTQRGDELVLEGVVFRPQSSELETSSRRELGRAARLMKAGQGFRYVVEVDLYGYQRDSVQSSVDLTEIQYDTAHFTVTTVVTDSLGVATQTQRDSVSLQTTYHNDRTVQQALEIVNYLIDQGVPPAGMIPVGRAYDAVVEERKTLVKLRVQ